MSTLAPVQKQKPKIRAKRIRAPKLADTVTPFTVAPNSSHPDILPSCLDTAHPDILPSCLDLLPPEAKAYKPLRDRRSRSKKGTVMGIAYSSTSPKRMDKRTIERGQKVEATALLISACMLKVKPIIRLAEKELARIERRPGLGLPLDTDEYHLAKLRVQVWHDAVRKFQLVIAKVSTTDPAATKVLIDNFIWPNY